LEAERCEAPIILGDGRVPTGGIKNEATPTKSKKDRATGSSAHFAPGNPKKYGIFKNTRGWWEVSGHPLVLEPREFLTECFVINFHIFNDNKTQGIN
jgi:hypothetical protein